MRRRALDLVTCPVCHSELVLEAMDREDNGDIESGMVACSRGHRFPVADGVPRLLPGLQPITNADARAIWQSFSREWQHFDYETDRTWGQTVDERREDFLRHVDLPVADLAGKLVLDAGCGNGALSVAISSFGCEVLATDLSDSVVSANRYFSPEKVHFVQSDLMRPAFKKGIFDVVYCAGVLHHTPDTRATLTEVVDAVAPGGSIFIWVYRRVPGVHARLSEAIRRLVAPMPARMKHAFVATFLLPQAVLRERLSSRRHPGRGSLNWREVLVRQLDSFTPRYRWVHTQEEVRAWYQELGLVSIKTTEDGEWGFGLVARRPAAEAREGGDREPLAAPPG